MTSLPWYVIPRRAAFFLGVAAISLSPAPSQAQQTPPLTPTETTAPVSAEVFPYELGHATRAGSVYSISATQPLTSALKGQKLRLKIVDAVTTGTDTRFFTLATGKYKTVAQLDVFLVDVFRRFLATPSPAPNQDLGKIGDVRYGGEVHFHRGVTARSAL